MKNSTRTLWEGLLYEAPSVKTLDILSEGLLCVSAPGMTIDSATEEDWETL